ncbi:MAG: SYNERG-CTERM sorting domain-containing protein [Synergistaceae bacterium]|nr:SYNERG-CTERM sorting domain-containing protein [Synergistaceae bacterium]
MVTALIPASPGSELKTAVLAVVVSGGNLPRDAKSAGDLVYVKMKGGAVGYETLRRADRASELADGVWLIKDSATKEILHADSQLEAGKEYELNIAIRDNGPLDHNTEAGKVTDPGGLVKKTEIPVPPVPPSPESGSGGCSAGFTWLLVFAALPVLQRRKR